MLITTPPQSVLTRKEINAIVKKERKSAEALKHCLEKQYEIACHESENFRKTHTLENFIKSQTKTGIKNALREAEQRKARHLRELHY